VLDAALALQTDSDGLFDISLGTGPGGWLCSDGRLHKLADDVKLDLGGIGKGYAVDCAVQTLIDLGIEAGWVNAGGDLRSFGDVDVPVHLRDESLGGVRPFASVRDGAFATSMRNAMHTSVAAPRCIWADALNKIVAVTADASHPLLARFDAVAWIHQSR
jgi:thiamine biosynthesis lipoprotein